MPRIQTNVFWRINNFAGFQLFDFHRDLSNTSRQSELTFEAYARLIHGYHGGIQEVAYFPDGVNATDLCLFVFE